MDLFRFYDKISVKNTQSGSAARGVLAVVSLKLLHIRLPHTNILTSI